MNFADIFENVVQLPDPLVQAQFEQLVGLDDAKQRLVKETLLLLDPGMLAEWSKKHHKKALKVLDYFAARPPLFVLAGDVGTGKSALARSFGNEVARRARVQVHFYSLSLNARGNGAVGEMTKLISGAFQQISDAVAKTRDRQGKAGRGIILLIDEADALAQSREASQMHHEDRAGVNALIRGIDDIAARRLPVATVMCTNRLDAIDPAVRRRAAAIFDFKRPNKEQRKLVLHSALEDIEVDDNTLMELVQATGETADRPYGFTYSDLTQRLVPHLILDAFPDHPLCASRAIEVANSMAPTPPFRIQ